MKRSREKDDDNRITKAPRTVRGVRTNGMECEQQAGSAGTLSQKEAAAAAQEDGNVKLQKTAAAAAAATAEAVPAVQPVPATERAVQSAVPNSRQVLRPLRQSGSSRKVTFQTAAAYSSPGSARKVPKATAPSRSGRSPSRYVTRIVPPSLLPEVRNKISSPPDSLPAGTSRSDGKQTSKLGHPHVGSASGSPGVPSSSFPASASASSSSASSGSAGAKSVMSPVLESDSSAAADRARLDEATVQEDPLLDNERGSTKAHASSPPTTDRGQSLCLQSSSSSSVGSLPELGSIESVDGDFDARSVGNGSSSSGSTSSASSDGGGSSHADDGALSDHPPTLNFSEILERQAKALKQRQKLRRANLGECERRGLYSISRKRRRASSSGVEASDGEEEEEDRPGTTEEEWLRALRIQLNANPDFFVSAQATLRLSGAIGRGKVGYASLKINELNNLDMKRIFTLRYEAKKNAGQPVGTYEQLKTAVGQFARLCCVKGAVQAEDLWKEGELFALITDMEAVRGFMQYFQLRGMHSTTSCKALHLKTLCDSAETFFSAAQTREQAVLRRKAAETGQYLSSVMNAEKTEGRRQSRIRRTLEDRIARAVILFPKDFARLNHVAFGKLVGVMKEYQKKALEVEPSELPRFLTERSLLNLFCINFQAVLMLNGGGQRPQVYAELLVPESSELRAILDCRDNFFELKTVHEKTGRSPNMPHVLFPGKLVPYLKFYLEAIRPVIVSSTYVTETQAGFRRLLLDTRRGCGLTSPQVRRTLKKFITYIDPDLRTITPMSLRGSYATWMLQRYRAGKIFSHLEEPAFLSVLARQMNTSVEQLQNTYAGIDKEDFKILARQLTEAFELVQTGALECRGDDSEE